MARLTQRLGFTRYEADEYYRMALDFFKKGNFDEAVDHMNHAINTLPGRAEYHAARGFFYLEDGVTDKAETDFKKALKLYSFEMLANYGLGVIAYNAGKWNDALKFFTNAHHADPNRAETLYYLAMTYHRQNNNRQAMVLMEQAQDAFNVINDRRRTQAGKWIQEFKRLIDTGEKEAE